jgi:hypothetical protein
MDREDQIRAARRALLAEGIGLVPAFIRVEDFGINDDGGFGPYRFRWMVEERWGAVDDPKVSPEKDEWPEGGHGGYVHHSVRRGEYSFDFGNDWWCDRSGHVTST